MTKNSSLTPGQLLVLFCSAAPFLLLHPDVLNATWAPFSPLLQLYTIFVMTFLWYCLRLFFFSDTRPSLTWFDGLLLVVIVGNMVESCFSSVTYGELIWRETNFIGLLVVHWRINKIPIFSSRQQRRPESVADETGENSSTDPGQITEVKAIENQGVGTSSWQFWVLLTILLSSSVYPFVMETLELDPVAVLKNKGAHVTSTGIFGSVTSIDSFSGLTNADLSHFRRLTSLERLLIVGRGVSDMGLLHLEGLSSLKLLRLQETQATDTGVAKLKKALPNCKIVLMRYDAKTKTF